MWRTIVTALIILAPPLTLGLVGLTAEMALAIVAGGIAAAFINIDKIQRVKGAGFEAEMRKVVDEAYATTTALRNIGKPLVKTTLDILTMEGRWGGMDPHEKHAFLAELSDMISDLNIEGDAGVKAAFEKFHRYHIWDHFNRFIEEVSAIPSIPKEVREPLIDMSDYSSSDYPTRQQITSAMGNHVSELGTNAKERLEDYLYYLEYGELRRREAIERR